MYAAMYAAFSVLAALDGMMLIAHVLWTFIGFLYKCYQRRYCDASLEFSLAAVLPFP